MMLSVMQVRLPKQRSCMDLVWCRRYAMYLAMSRFICGIAPFFHSRARPKAVNLRPATTRRTRFLYPSLLSENCQTLLHAMARNLHSNIN